MRLKNKKSLNLFSNQGETGGTLPLHCSHLKKTPATSMPTTSRTSTKNSNKKHLHHPPHNHHHSANMDTDFKHIKLVVKVPGGRGKRTINISVPTSYYTDFDVYLHLLAHEEMRNCILHHARKLRTNPTQNAYLHYPHFSFSFTLTHDTNDFRFCRMLEQRLHFHLHPLGINPSVPKLARRHSFPPN